MNRRDFVKYSAAASSMYGMDALSLANASAPDGARYVMLHVSGGNACGRPAALMLENPAFGSVIRSSIFRKLGGFKFEPYSLRKCGSCGTLFNPVRHGIYTNEVEPKPVPPPRMSA